MSPPPPSRSVSPRLGLDIDERVASLSLLGLDDTSTSTNDDASICLDDANDDGSNRLQFTTAMGGGSVRVAATVGWRECEAAEAVGRQECGG